ncbi:MAG: efflux transporter outer membrane subunit [Parachlamydiaceae bacterium]|nr:efflux transporter outer membrane subunit [Parachlamydiaceae bacterium]
MRFLIIFSICLAGCTPYEKYEPPSVYSPSGWKNPDYADNVQALGQWWYLFEDEELNALEGLALEKNYSIEEAFQNWQQARALAFVARSAQFPQASLNPNFSKKNNLILFQGPGQVNTRPFRIEQAQYSLPLDVSYEVDFWHKIYDNYKAHLYNAESRFEAYNNMILSITADVALHYYTLRGLDSELDVLEMNRKIRQDAYDISLSKYEAGLVNFTDVSRAETELASVLADFENTSRLRNLEENILGTLTTVAASEFFIPHNPLKKFPPSIPAGIPSSLLLRRPDIRQAEREMASTHMQVAVQYAAYFPSLSFEGGIGFFSPLLHNLIDWKARFWSIAGNIAQVVFDGGAIQGNVAAAKAVYLQNVARYQDTVLRSFQEVEDALGNIHYVIKQEKDLIKAVKSAQVTFTLSSDRYRQGLVTYLEVVDAERSLLENQRLVVKAHTQEYLFTISLIKSLGGGWNDECH